MKVSRRRAGLLALVAPLAVVKPAFEAEPAHAKTDSRPAFRRSDYVIYILPKKPGSYPCPVHGIDHKVWTRGCHPVAWPKCGIIQESAHIDPVLRPAKRIDDNYYDMVPNSGVLPVTDDAVPLGLECPVNYADFRDNLTHPHTHNEFRWID